jgi:protein-disulfide isomerase
MSGDDKRLLLFSFAILLIVVGVAFVGWVKNFKPEEITGGSIRPVTSADHTLGPLSAPVRAIVYSDLECPYCKVFHEKTSQALQKKYGDKLLIAYRHFLLPHFPQSRVEAEAAECAYLQGGNDAFWAYISEVFRQTPSENKFPIDELPNIAERLNLNLGVFKKCLSSIDNSRVLGDDLEARTAGLSTTPSVVLLGKDDTVIISGNYPSRIMAGIDYLLLKDSN